MEYRKLQSMNIFSPNFIVVCVDRFANGECGGRFYHCYEEEPVVFESTVDFVMKADRFYDEIAFPQASTKARSFNDNKDQGSGCCYNVKRPDKTVSSEKLLTYNGDVGTFALSVEFRQNSTWQGEMMHLESGEHLKFAEVLGLLTKIDEILSEKEA